MKILLSSLIVIVFARLVFGLGAVIFVLPFGTIYGPWQRWAPNVMTKARRLFTSLCQFIGFFVAVIATVVFGFYIFHVISAVHPPSVISFIAVSIPMIFSIRADIRNWKKMHALVSNNDQDLPDEVRQNIDSEIVSIHRVGVAAKTCGLLVAFLYFFYVGDDIILPYFGIR